MRKNPISKSEIEIIKTIIKDIKNGKLITNYKKDESPDTGDYSLPVNYVIAVGLAALGAIFLLCRKET